MRLSLSFDLCNQASNFKIRLVIGEICFYESKKLVIVDVIDLNFVESFFVILVTNVIFR